MKRVFGNIILILYSMMQLSIFGLCFFLFTATIKVFPWYEPLTMGPFLGLMYVVPIQFFISFIISICRKTTLINSDVNFISDINLCILFLIIFITRIKDKLFYPLATVCAFAECLLSLVFIIIIIRTLVRREYL